MEYWKKETARLQEDQHSNTPALQYSVIPSSSAPPLHHSIFSPSPLRHIVHLDADAFFASVEQAADPRLRGKPVAVGGEKRGVIASASYEARRFGVGTAMPTVRARRLCPHLIVVPGDFEKYERFSRWMFSYAQDFTPDVEVASIDEGYFDVTGARQPPAEIAETIRRAIRQSLKISVSEGLAANKLVSQIASKLHKPAAFLEVPAGREKIFLHPLANHWLPGLGPQTARRFDAAGLTCIGQIAVTPLEFLALLVGRAAPQLQAFANGLDDRPVTRVAAPAQSYGQQQTFAADTTDEAFLEATLRRMADELMAALRRDGASIRTVTVKVRYNDLAEDQRSESLAEPTDLETDLYPRLRPLLRQAWKRRVSLRLVALKLSNVYRGVRPAELPLEPAPHQYEARRRLAQAVDALRETHGRYVIFRGHDLLLRQNETAPTHHCHSERSPAAVAAGRSEESRCSRGALPEQPKTAEILLPRLRDQNDRNRVVATVPPHRQSPVSGLRSPVCGLQSLPLRVHSHYSFLDSTLSIPAIIELTQRYQLPAVALTDTGNLHGAVEFVQAARAAGLHPILGAEFQGRLFFVENAIGYRNLCRILSRDDHAIPLAPTHESLLTLPGDGQTLSREGARDRLSPCGRGRPRVVSGTGEGEVRSLRHADTTGLIVENAADWPAVHYATPADRLRYDIVQSIRTLTLLRQEHPAKKRGGQFHFPRPGEPADPARARRAHEIAERCQFAFDLGRLQFPAFAPPDGSTPREFLRQLVLEGLQRRYQFQISHLKSQIAEELAIIHDVGYEEYFLIVWDLLQQCRRRGIEWITRGSAADSLVCYCLGISDVCPLRFDLYFRRFLNRERMKLNKLPDIDVDFPHDRKDDVVKLAFEKYGPDHAAVVGGFSTYQGRSALADIGKVLGLSEYQARRFTERLPHVAAHDLSDAVGQSLECRDLPLAEEPYATALRLAQFLDGFPRYPKMHPCGVVLSRAPMLELTPCFTSAKGWPTTHFDMDSVEAIGLVKIDILAQGGLAVMRDAREMIRGEMTPPHPARMPHQTVTTPRQSPLPAEGSRVRETPLSCAAKAGPVSFTGTGEGDPRFQLHRSDSPGLHWLEPWDDPRVWELIAGGGARAVHHIESPAMISLCRMCHVREIDGLIAIVSVIRPGASNGIKKLTFTRRYQGLEPVAYPHPSLEPCLKSTFGMVVYEEHILQICEAFAGLPADRADVLRRALVKEHWPVVEQLAAEFARCARAHGRTDAEIAAVWKAVGDFHGYAFCKAHSTAYGVEAYQAAWLKCYHPAEFLAAVLSNGKGFYRPLVYVLECHRLGIPLLPPWINEPGPKFTVNAGKIRVPATRVKGLAARTVERLLAEHAHGPFASLEDFHRRVAPSREELEALLNVGAFDNFGPPRTAQFWEIQQLAQDGHAASQPISLSLSREHPLTRRPASSGTPASPARGEAKAAVSSDVCGPPLPKEGEAGPRSGRGTGEGDSVFQLHGSGLASWPESPAVVPQVPLTEPTRLERLRWENELLGFPASGHPLELHPDIAWDTYCSVAELGRHAGETVTMCGLIIEDRLHHQVTGELMKFLTLADRTGIIETELFAPTYKTYGLATVRYPVLEITATVEPFENGNGYSLRVHRAAKPRRRPRS